MCFEHLNKLYLFLLTLLIFTSHNSWSNSTAADISLYFFFILSEITYRVMILHAANQLTNACWSAFIKFHTCLVVRQQRQQIKKLMHDSARFCVRWPLVLCLHEDHCVQSPFSAGPARIGLHFSPTAKNTPKLPGRSPTHLYQVSKIDMNNL